MEHIKSYQRTLDSVRLPIEHFIKTGFWDPHALDGWEENDISEQQVRNKCRQVARELKRPFIIAHPVMQFYEHRPTGKTNSYGHPSYKWTRLEQPRFSHAFVEVPKRKYLYPLVSSLLLLPQGQSRWDSGDGKAAISLDYASLWQFRINDETLWRQYYDFILNDPECRAARRLTS